MKFISLDCEFDQPSGELLQLAAVAYDTDRPKGEEKTATFNDYITLDGDKEPNWDFDLARGKGEPQSLGELLKHMQPRWKSEAIGKKEALERFWAWLRRQQAGKRLVQWGRGDVAAIISATKEAGLNYPSRLRVVDAKLIYKELYQPASRFGRGFGLESACRAIGLGVEQAEWHDALVDASWTAEVYLRIYRDIEFVAKVRGGLIP